MEYTIQELLKLGFIHYFDKVYAKDEVIADFDIYEQDDKVAIQLAYCQDELTAKVDNIKLIRKHIEYLEAVAAEYML